MPSRSLPKLLFTESVMPSKHLILCRPLLLPPSIFPSIRVFSNESALRMRWPKYWSFSFSISPSNGSSGFISFSSPLWPGKAGWSLASQRWLEVNDLGRLVNRYGRRQWQPTPVLLPGKSHGRRSLEGCSPWGHRIGHNKATELN